MTDIAIDTRTTESQDRHTINERNRALQLWVHEALADALHERWGRVCSQ